jgi:prepilin-type N-terminal cleavage/methylation domain-containing protein
MCKRSRANGFTLVEVVVATAILAIGLVGALTAFSMASRVSGVSNADTTLAFLAQEKLADIQLYTNEDIAKIETAGDFAPDHPDYKWQLFVQKPDENNVVSVDVVISYPASGRIRETTFSTRVF